MKSTLVRYLQRPELFVSYLGRHGFLNWVPDKTYLSMRYRMFMGEKLNLDNPMTFNEKIQWLKLNDHNPLYSTLVDKIKVKEYIGNRYSDIKVIPTIGVWDRAEQIDFDTLPDQFVLKCNHDSNSVVICRDRDKFDYEACRKKLNNALKRNFYNLAREWAYKNVKPQILAEPYMGGGKGL